MNGTDGAPGAQEWLELDCRQMRCPAPIIELARHIGDVAVGQLIGVAATDVAARIDVPAWCRMRGHEYAGEATADDGVPVFLVRRTDAR
ncbi:sulfurtransferase TusA family protein [Nocardioides sp. AE5]|uniref:sulfurtransferase TusA family protein n=1 Tax=Nocardioides sp. AE5 TaxID=2962573 RepID=UPI002881E25A|nr:sulfurtransferase TusA family protein [Nocardioides sp. AE5]MDT0201170.1 sulfurtransferase TusA family protein [Nocardioides sp. AE5]